MGETIPVVVSSAGLSILEVPTRGLDGGGQDRVYSEIKEEILTLRLKPNAHLNAGALGARLKVSRTPVREALVRLEQEGLAVRQPSGGFAVACFSLKEVNDIYRVREVLEVEAALEAIERVTKEWAEGAEATLAKCRQLIVEKKYPELVFESRAIHASIMELSDNSAFKMVMGPIIDRVRIIGAMLIDVYPPRSGEVFEENRNIVDALKRQDRKAVAFAVRTHVQNARKRAMEYLSNDQRHLYAGVAPRRHISER